MGVVSNPSPQTQTMDSFDLVIVNGVVVTASDIAEYDIGIKDEKISLLAPKGFLANATAKRVIDAQGGYVMVCHLLLSNASMTG